MAHRCVRKLRLATASSYAHARTFHSTTSRLDALAVPSAASSSSSTPREDNFSNTPLGRKIADIRALLEIKSPSPHRVWASYVELLQFYGSSGVPRDIHQGVLRKCSPSAAHLRAVSAKLMAEGGRFRDALLYETRFRDVIRNLRSSGGVPALEDYHCVLDQFAALGNHESAMRVLDEITQVGLAKQPDTYGLCLRALSYRLTLPVWHLRRPMLVDEITEHCMNILEEMSQENVAYTPTNVDLAFRILKETLNMQGFAALLKGAFGIDLAYPDRSPLEFWEKKAAAPAEDAAEDGLSQRLPTRMPFTCSTLNTALDYLGRAGNVSKMVQLFEVTTNPLPSSTSNPAFNDDEDDDFGISNPQVAPYSPPHIRPNTTTFHIMLRHIHKAGHEVLARHYLLVALEAGRNEGRSLREMTRTKPPEEIVSPRVSVTRSLLLSVASLANDNKDVDLLRWVSHKTRQTARWKRRDLDYYTQVRARWIAEGLYQPPALSDAALEGVEEELPLGPSSSRFSSFFSPSSSLSHIDNSTAPSTSAPETKPLDIDLHVNLLRRDLHNLIAFEARVDDVLARTVQRIKERLGRRVWGGKNIFLSDVERRLPVSREFWKRNVNYRPLSEVRAQSVAPPARRQSGKPKPSAPARAEHAPTGSEADLVSPPSASASTSAPTSQGQS